jgi:hypothetical protein
VRVRKIEGNRRVASSTWEKIDARFEVSAAMKKNRDRSVLEHWATGWMIGGSSLGRGREFFSSPLRPDRLWGPPSLRFNGCQGLFPWG